MADGVSYGASWKGPITYSFNVSSDQYGYTYEPLNNFAAITEHQANSALFALEQSFGGTANDGFSVEGFTKAKISLGDPSDATLRFGQSDTPTTAHAYLPGSYEQAGDIWFGRNYDYTNATAGNYAWHAMLHEIGHGLGLKHGHEKQNGFRALPTNYDSPEFTLMTYRSYVGSGIGGYSYAEWSAPQTYMMADIAALQKLYGADYTTNSGKTTYSWRPDSGNTFVNGEVAIEPGGTVIFATVWDGGGRDTYDLSAYTTDLKINLGAGKGSTFDVAQLADLGDGNSASASIYNALLFKNDRRSLIENAEGGSGADIIIGNAVRNRLDSGDGDDTLLGGRGRDKLFGGNGDDLLKGGRDQDLIVGGAGNDMLWGGRMADVFHFSVSSGYDTIADFRDGEDKLSIDIPGVSRRDLIDSARQYGKDLVLTIDEENTITILDFDRADFSARDFVL